MSLACVRLGQPQLLARELGAGDQPLELLGGDPARHRKEAAVGHGRQACEGNELRAQPEPLGAVLRALPVERLDAAAAAGHVAVAAAFLPAADLRPLAAGVLHYGL